MRKNVAPPPPLSGLSLQGDFPFGDVHSIPVRMKKILRAFLAPVLAASLILPAPVRAERYDGMLDATILPGWRLPNGDHIAALHLRLAPGWKTYWRSPGDAGIPPSFDWQGAQNTRSVTVSWPSPQVFWQSGMRSVGYHDEVVLPLRVSLRNAGKDAQLNGTIEIGICKDVCLPQRLKVSATLPAGSRKPDPRIAAAMADVPFGRGDAGVTSVTCTVSATPKGIGLNVALTLPGATGNEETVIEFADPELWVAEPQTSLRGGQLVAETRVTHLSRAAFALDRSEMVLTVLGGRMPVEVRGCD